MSLLTVPFCHACGTGVSSPSNALIPCPTREHFFHQECCGSYYEFLRSYLPSWPLNKLPCMCCLRDRIHWVNGVPTRPCQENNDEETVEQIRGALVAHAATLGHLYVIRALCLQNNTFCLSKSDENWILCNAISQKNISAIQDLLSIVEDPEDFLEQARTFVSQAPDPNEKTSDEELDFFQEINRLCCQLQDLLDQQVDPICVLCRTAIYEHENKHISKITGALHVFHEACSQPYQTDDSEEGWTDVGCPFCLFDRISSSHEKPISSWDCLNELEQEERKQALGVAASYKHRLLVLSLSLLPRQLPEREVASPIVFNPTEVQLAPDISAQPASSNEAPASSEKSTDPSCTENFIIPPTYMRRPLLSQKPRFYPNLSSKISQEDLSWIIFKAVDNTDNDELSIKQTLGLILSLAPYVSDPAEALYQFCRTAENSQKTALISALINQNLWRPMRNSLLERAFDR